MIDKDLRTALDRQVDLAVVETLAARTPNDRSRARRMRLETLMTLADLESRISGYRFLLAMFPAPMEGATIALDLIPEPFEMN